ncbi:MAG TPA: response regulator [Chloroflexi bacterium]|nr:response regulator [Chloroflexota bacterium]
MYLTPAAVSYLTQIILVLAIVGFFIYHSLSQRRLNETASVGLLLGFFAATAVFILLLFFETASLPARRLQVVYLENTAVGLILLLLLQFACHFPNLPSKRKWEARLTLGLSALYTLFEAGFALYRFAALRQGLVLFRPPWPDYALVLGFLWVPLVFVRQAVYASRQTRTDLERSAGGRDQFGLAHLWRPRGQNARAARFFALVYLLPVSMSLVNLLRGYRLIPASLYHASLSVTLLFSLFLFAIVYLNSLPERSTFMVKLVGATLLSLLVVLGVVSWNIMPAYVASYSVPSPEGQSLRFTPNDAGGYNVAATPFHFERELGDNLGLADTWPETDSVPLDFAFPFYGQTYRQVYIMNDGAVGLGQPIDHRTIQYHYGASPAIFPLYLDLIPQAGEGGIFARREADKLVITWDHVPAFQAQQTTYTFQLTLRRDGVFEISYKDIPPYLTFRPDSDPEDDIWFVGATPGNAAQLGATRPLPQQVDLADLPLVSGPQGVAFDYYLAFRRQLHYLFAPLAQLILAGSLAILLGFPLLFHVNLVRPLNALLSGVRRLETGDYTVNVPVQYADEIGFLTRAFNALAAQLGDLIHTLEARVAARTAELDAANTQLRAEIIEREQAQSALVEQQRELATLAERERLSRELHDGLGQVMSYINVQAQTVETMLDAGQVEPAQSNLQRIAQTAQDAHADIRHFILGLRAEDAPRQDFWETLRRYLRQFQTTCGIETDLSLPDGAPLSAFGPVVEEQLLRIIQEALTNVRKHAAASRVQALFSFSAGAVHVIIADDGCGFDADRLTGESPTVAKSHFGLIMMRERAEAVGGQVEIRSAPEQGACVLIHLPHLSSAPEGDAQISDLSGLRLLLADDHPLFLEGLNSLLTARGFSVVGTAPDGESALQQTRALRPDAVIMDVNMPGGGGLEAARAIKAELPDTKIVMLTVAEDDAHLFEAVKSGVSGYLLKSLDANQFCELLTGLLRDDAPLAPGLAARIMSEFSRQAERETEREDRPDLAALSLRQEEILSLVAQGLVYKEVANRLNLSEKTIKYHMTQIIEKLGVENRAQAIARYLSAQK